MTFIPAPEKLARLGYSMPTHSYGKHASVTYFNIERTKAVVIWPASQEVRLAVLPSSMTSWSALYTGVVPNEQAFDELMILEAFILPQQLKVA